MDDQEDCPTLESVPVHLRVRLRERLNGTQEPFDWWSVKELWLFAVASMSLACVKMFDSEVSDYNPSAPIL